MSQKEKTNVIIYRFREQGLEVFLVNPGEEQSVWQIPQQELDSGNQAFLVDGDRIIALDPVEEAGILEQSYAVEADWHDIPSMKDILRHDVRFMKDTVLQMIPDMMQRGTFVAIKDAFKRVLPHQYKQLKELKEILIDRNLTKYM